jgi:hypothetical protein
METQVEVVSDYCYHVQCKHSGESLTQWHHNVSECSYGRESLELANGRRRTYCRHPSGMAVAMHALA